MLFKKIKTSCFFCKVVFPWKYQELTNHLPRSNKLLPAKAVKSVKPPWPSHLLRGLVPPVGVNFLRLMEFRIQNNESLMSRDPNCAASHVSSCLNPTEESGRHQTNHWQEQPFPIHIGHPNGLTFPSKDCLIISDRKKTAPICFSVAFLWSHRSEYADQGSNTNSSMNLRCREFLGRNAFGTCGVFFGQTRCKTLREKKPGWRLLAPRWDEIPAWKLKHGIL